MLTPFRMLGSSHMDLDSGDNKIFFIFDNVNNSNKTKAKPKGVKKKK